MRQRSLLSGVREGIRMLLSGADEWPRHSNISVDSLFSDV
jgi:hypothetical protein